MDSRSRQQIADVDPFFFAFSSRPITKTFLYQLQVLRTFETLLNLRIVQVEPRKYFSDRDANLSYLIFL